MDLVLIFVDRTVSGDGNNDIADSLLSAVSIRQTASVTGPRPTSARTTFSIAGSEKAKGFGDYGSCRASQAAFTSGHAATRKVNRITKGRKSPRQ